LFFGFPSISSSHYQYKICSAVVFVSLCKRLEPLVRDPSPFEVEIAIAKLKRYKSPRSDQSLAELIQAGGEI
jgi:hypothetical protein